MKEFRITIPNQPGELSELMGILGDDGINARSVNCNVSEGASSLVTLVPYDEKAARKTLNERQINFEESEILPVDLLDKPGELGRISRVIADAGVNIESVYLLGRLGSGETARVQVGFRLDEVEKAKEAIKATEEWAPKIGGEG